ncbi:MAG: UdgX family uracil-DNA binding protein [Bauldia sp.]
MAEISNTELEARSAAATSLATLAKEAEACRRCPLYKAATQVVFGEGPATAAMVLVGEQPGDQEDLAGHPFVGPAGKLLDRALADAGIERSAVYVTNAVKHFKHEQRGKRRMHKRPNQYEISRCRWWLDLELKLVNPKLVVALGATAAGALAGRAVSIAREREKPLPIAGGRRGFVTMHPSAILRMRDERERNAAMELLVRDLRDARALLRR